MPLVMVDKVPLRLHLRTTFIPFHSALTTSGLVICSSSLTRGAPPGRVRSLSVCTRLSRLLACIVFSTACILVALLCVYVQSVTLA